MNKEQVCKIIREVAIIPAVRVSTATDAQFAAEAVARGGIPIVEITLTVAGALDLIARLVREYPDVVVGAGTVLDTETARRCLDVGAGFITAPELNVEVTQFVAKANVTVLPGALTPTEVTNAWRAGGDFVKVFPCSSVGGETYIKSLHTGLPQIPLMAAGGVNQQTAASYILAGAEVIGVGRELIPTEAIERRQADRIRELAHRFAGFVRDARQRLDGARTTTASVQHHWQR